ncbi:hypothetical protein DPMN_047625 [Dreissena polymorpha]|uniref:Uncharacterized protein n=1 Tax=Dreissena polymorpha TaxID=45954 RepID=A0A9D4D8D8_DREPO|nr:hypothetical protein DPMN_047625 [Dreissena polymorpha]
MSPVDLKIPRSTRDILLTHDTTRDILSTHDRALDTISSKYRANVACRYATFSQRTIRRATFFRRMIRRATFSRRTMGHSTLYRANIAQMSLVDNLSLDGRHTTFKRHSSDIFSMRDTTRDNSVDSQDFLRHATINFALSGFRASVISCVERMSRECRASYRASRECHASYRASRECRVST